MLQLRSILIEIPSSEYFLGFSALCSLLLLPVMVVSWTAKQVTHSEWGLHCAFLQCVFSSVHCALVNLCNCAFVQFCNYAIVIFSSVHCALVVRETAKQVSRSQVIVDSNRINLTPGRQFPSFTIFLNAINTRGVRRASNLVLCSWFFFSVHLCICAFVHRCICAFVQLCIVQCSHNSSATTGGPSPWRTSSPRSTSSSSSSLSSAATISSPTLSTQSPRAGRPS